MRTSTFLTALAMAASTVVLAQDASPDGTCGRFFGTTCDGNLAGTGGCCGANNLCGSDDTACGTGCQADYGWCMSSSAMSSSAAGGAGGLGAAGLAPSISMSASSSTGMPMMSSSSRAPTSMMADSAGQAYSRPASMMPPSGSSMTSMPKMSSASAPTASMAMDGIRAGSASMPPPSMAWAGQGHLSKNPPSGAWMAGDRYNATVTVTNCSGKASPTGPAAAWNGTMPNATAAMPTGHTCNGGCHKPEYSSGAGRAIEVLRVSSLGMVLAGVVGGLVLLG